MAGIIVFIFSNGNKLSSHMDQISEHINSSKHKIQYFEKMIKITINLGSKKGKNNKNSLPQLTRLQNYLLMSVVDTPEKDLSNVDGKYYMRKVITSSVNSSSKLFSCSIHSMYNRVNRNKKMSHVEVIYSWY